MDIEQIIKRIDWLEEQRRKDKVVIAALEENITSLEGQLSSTQQQLKEIAGEVARLNLMVGKIDQFDTDLAQNRIELTRTIDELEKRRVEHEREIEGVRRVQIEGINNHLIDLKKGLEPISELQNGMKVRIEEEMRLSRMLDELKQEHNELKREEDEWNRSVRLVEESSRRDNKRLTDLQGEVLALRKRVDEHRGRLDLSDDNLRKMTNRISEFAASETERKDVIANFFDKQNLIQSDKERKWKEWQSRFDLIEKQALDLEGHLQSLHVAQRDVKRAQEAVEVVTERVERRINEITEMQRLAEDRFRQEWVTFKADDQKRWTNYSLTQEEQSRETSRQQSKINEQITTLGDQVQDVADIVHQLEEQTDKRLQSLLTIARDWVADFDKLFGRART